MHVLVGVASLDKRQAMVIIKKQEEKLLIEISHPCPREFHKDLKEAIIGTIQYHTDETGDLKELHFINHTLLELLKNLEFPEPEEYKLQF